MNLKAADSLTGRSTRSSLATFFLSFLVMMAGACAPTSSPELPQARPPDQPQHFMHEVKSGETLYSIAKRYQVPLAVVIDTNGLANASYLSPGDMLRIPGRMTENSAVGRSRGRMVPLGFAKAFVGTLAWPCESKELSSRFGSRNGSFHEGIDIRARPGTDVYAAHSGKVVYSGRGLRGYGKLVAIRGDGIMTVYGHNSRALVDKYEYVSLGEKIAESGSSGTSTGPHLHFEIRLMDQKGRYYAVDPLVFYPQH